MPGDMSDHFSRWELRCPCCHKCEIDPTALGQADRLRDFFDRKTTVNSGFRCPKHNAEIGGSRRSQHMRGLALDVVVEGVPPLVVGWVTRLLGWRGVEIHKTFTHIDWRKGRLFRKGF